ncbi:MAG: DUF721 domain-containing protein [Phycisphaerae bacterium]|nr:DUF721 domain-containing protein [Phycisphaerae bacterium]
MTDRMDEDRFLRQAGRGKPMIRDTAQLLGANVQTYIKGRLGPLRRNAGVVDVWRQLLPNGLAAHCQISAIRGDVVEVEVDPGPYMHELRVLSTEIIDQLQRYCGRAQVRRLVLRPRREVITETEETI